MEVVSTEHRRIQVDLMIDEWSNGEFTARPEHAEDVFFHSGSKGQAIEGILRITAEMIREEEG